MRPHLKRYLPFVLCIVIVEAGCAKPGPAVTEVQGKVSYNGKAVTAGTVKFVPATLEGDVVRPASGAIAADGTYQISAFPGRNGSRPGEYQVAVVAYTGSFMDGTAKYLVPKRFADPKTSGLKATVPAKRSEPLILDFNLVD